VTPSMGGAGVVVCLGGTIEPADDVVKMHASALDTFASPNGGSLGRVDASGVTVFRRRAGRRRVETTRAAERVHLITATVAMNGSLLDAAVAAGADGIVVAATGAGNTDPALLAAAERAMAAGMPVALATRCIAGRAGTAYAFPGGGATWVRAGALPVGHLCAIKARIALALGLGAGLDRDRLAALLADPLP
jgi:L-asparaginase